jgi:xanthine dehydrogenase accessory factor
MIRGPAPGTAPAGHKQEHTNRMNDNFIERMAELVERGEPFAQACVLQQAGSAPRTAGARMLVFPGDSPHGSMEGSIGGGRVEAEAMNLAREALEDQAARCIEFDLAAGADMDMICGGGLEVLVEPLAHAQRHLAVLRRSVELMRANRRHALLTILRDGPDGLRIERRIALDGVIEGGGPAIPAEHLDPAVPWRLVVMRGGRCLVEGRVPAHSVYIFGAGHVGQAVARLAAMTGFRVVVVDDRGEFASRERFPRADRLVVAEEFGGVLARELADEPVDELACMVIVTRGHEHDALVLAQALASRAGYVGMIGSRSKRDATYRALGEQGYGDADFARVHSPIGLDIDAQTPEEIAVAVVAELIAHRARMRGGR